MADLFQPSFWEEDEAELWEAVSGVLVSAYLSGIAGGVKILPAGVQTLVNHDMINHAAMEFAKNYRYALIKGITDTTRKSVQRNVGDWIASGSPLDTLTAALEPIFGEARAARIASTETTRAFSQGNMDAWESTGLVEEATWMTAEDDKVCPICAERDGALIGIGDIDSAPPNGSHVGCRCWLQPVVSEAALDRQLEEILA